MCFPLLQRYEVFVLSVAYFLYAYARPYKTTFVNIIEMALLAYLGLFLTLARGIPWETVNSIHLDETSVDSCGKALPPIGPAWIVVGVFYFLPVTVLLFLLGWWLIRVGQKCWYDIMCVCAYNIHKWVYVACVLCCVMQCVHMYVCPTCTMHVNNKSSMQYSV